MLQVYVYYNKTKVIFPAHYVYKIKFLVYFRRNINYCDLKMIPCVLNMKNIKDRKYFMNVSIASSKLVIRATCTHVLIP